VPTKQLEDFGTAIDVPEVGREIAEGRQTRTEHRISLTLDVAVRARLDSTTGDDVAEQIIFRSEQIRQYMRDRRLTRINGFCTYARASVAFNQTQYDQHRMITTVNTLTIEVVR
jgi:hypothetical protein